MLQGKVFLTGGAGYLGRGIMRKAQREGWDCSFTVYSRDEEKHAQARRRYQFRSVLGDICDYRRLQLAMTGHDIVIHTAALKYIPECEANPSECIRINIDGTRAVLEAAIDAEVRHVVCVSTDKAPQPINTYGMTKALVERMVQEYVAPGFTKINAVRFGNVIGSTGSVWPVWKEQAKTGVIKLTDPQMTRYMMGVDDAIETIETAVSLPVHGVVVIPSPKGVYVADIAQAVAVRLGAAVEVIGPRYGEKKHEQMISHYEARRLNYIGDTHDGKYVCLLPPTVNVLHNAEPLSVAGTLLSSDATRERMDSSEFITLAEDSESV